MEIKNLTRHRWRSPNREIDKSTRTLAEIDAELRELQKRVDDLGKTRGVWAGEERRRPANQ